MIEQRDMNRWTRELAAMIRKAGDDDPETFAIITQLLDDAQRKLPAAAARLREPGQNGVRGFTWAEIAAPLKISKQGAAQRFGKGQS